MINNPPIAVHAIPMLRLTLFSTDDITTAKVWELVNKFQRIAIKEDLILNNLQRLIYHKKVWELVHKFQRIATYCGDGSFLIICAPEEANAPCSFI